MNSKSYSQEWFEDGQIDEVVFCENFLQRMPLKCINGIFFSYDGMLPDSEVEKEIYRMVKPVLTKGISKKVKQLLEVLKLEAYSEELPVQMDRIHVNNGTYFLMQLLWLWQERNGFLNLWIQNLKMIREP